MNTFQTTNQVTQSTGAGMVLAGSLIYMAVVLAVCILIIVSLWKIFEKAGTKGVYAIIPIFNTYKMFELFMGNGLLMLLTFVPCIGIVFSFLCMWKMCKCFGKGAGFYLLMLFFPFIAYPMLAFSDAQYQNIN